MDKQEQLKKQIAEYDNIFEKRKQKRVIITFLGLSVAFYILGIILGEFQNITEYLMGLILAPVIAVIYMFVNTLIFLPLNTKAIDEAVFMEHLKTELHLLEKEQE